MTDGHAGKVRSNVRQVEAPRAVAARLSGKIERKKPATSPGNRWANQSRPARRSRTAAQHEGRTCQFQQGGPRIHGQGPSRPPTARLAGNATHGVFVARQAKSFLPDRVIFRPYPGRSLLMPAKLLEKRRRNALQHSARLVQTSEMGQAPLVHRPAPSPDAAGQPGAASQARHRNFAHSIE